MGVTLAYNTLIVNVKLLNPEVSRASLDISIYFNLSVSLYLRMSVLINILVHL